MTSSSVSNIVSTMTLTQGVETGNTAQGKQAFDLLLSKKSTDVTEKKDAEVSVNPIFPQAQQSYEKEMTESGYKDTPKITETDTRQEVVEKAKESYGELKEVVTKVLTEKLEISEEELLEAMNALGITFENLLQGNGLKELMMEFTGTDDVTDLLVNDVFLDLMQEIDCLVQQFTNEMEITSEQLEMVLHQLENQGMETEEIVFEKNQDPLQTEERQLQEAQSEQLEVNVEMINDEQNDLVNRDISETKTILTEEDANLNQQLQETKKSQTENDNLMNQGQGFEGQNKTLENSEISNEASKSQVTYQTTQTMVNALGEEVVQVVERVFVDVEDIMNQITEFTKVTVQQSQSSIEMQLNPEHLGKIYLQVVSKEGVITAQLAAQNEAVQQALESQVAVLKENMNQQGLKIEAVEVTIASHEFQQNFERDRQENAQENMEENNKKSQRFISVGQLDELAGLMTEEETLVAKMMLENGNSMDMTA